ncbi:hypothetical protein M427DRAFT_48923 [Gonapodya prolifera JEL478]|uniref:Uncharacterized protein n=1 Tax=Gonapodya prolifera (strain JEL478) TaxID=1344416 RepID=A0A138ZZQ1_GONPJ|nr:hypothetical protein M427DRAFT_48923 [Gonapodya prolifera JEL478]|eukprot:KXS09888.1 hypothetical protein M427DRAFT_48923 [Gonapodya prolifera JEL478]
MSQTTSSVTEWRGPREFLRCFNDLLIAYSLAMADQSVLPSQFPLCSSFQSNLAIGIYNLADLDAALDDDDDAAVDDDADQMWESDNDDDHDDDNDMEAMDEDSDSDGDSVSDSDSVDDDHDYEEVPDGEDSPRL